MASTLETTVDLVHGEKYCYFCTSVPKYIRYIKNLIGDYPEDIKVLYDSTEHSDPEMRTLNVKLPAKWFKPPKPPRKVSEENKEKFKNRMASYRNQKEEDDECETD